MTVVDVLAVATGLLAHAAPGSAWQAMVVVAAVVLAGFVVAATVGRYPVERPDDLIVPLATAAVLSSLAPVVHEVLADAIAWSLPLGAVALLTLLVAALTPLRVRWPAPLPIAALVLAAVATVVLHRPLAGSLHPDSATTGADADGLADDGLADDRAGDPDRAGSGRQARGPRTLA